MVTKNNNSLESLPNIGKVLAAKLRRVGIKDKDDFLKAEPYKVFHTLRQKVDPKLCRCCLASIVAAKLGVPWHTITKETAKEYEKRHPRHTWGPC